MSHSKECTTGSLTFNEAELALVQGQFTSGQLVPKNRPLDPNLYPARRPEVWVQIDLGVNEPVTIGPTTTTMCILAKVDYNINALAKHRVKHRLEQFVRVAQGEH